MFANDIDLPGREKLPKTNVKATAFHLTSANEPRVLIQFEEEKEAQPAPVLPQAAEADAANAKQTADGLVTKDGQSVKHLRLELTQMRETLGTSIEELEANNEEMQSTNQEMIAANEELQATNEELQSVNEELHTVNIEHQRKVQELQEVTDDFNNLFNSTNVGLILLDQDMLIRKFTKASERYFNLLDHDIGRPLSNFAPRILIDDLFARVRQVIASGTPYRKKVRDLGQHVIAIEVFPYRSGEMIKGAILNLIDVTAANRDDDSDDPTEDRQREQQASE